MRTNGGRQYRSPMEFQAEAQQVLKYVHNLHVMLNTYTFIWWWCSFAIVVFISRWIPAPFIWVILVLALAHTIFRTYQYFPATTEYLHNLPHLRRLADEAQQNFSRDGIVPRRMSWLEILFGIGRRSNKPPRHVRDQQADWCMTQQELLMKYIISLTPEVSRLRHERRQERRARSRREIQSAQPKFVTAPVLPMMIAAARSTLPSRTPRVKVIRPVVRKPKPEPRQHRRGLDAPEVAVNYQKTILDLLDEFSVTDLLPSTICSRHAQTLIVWGCIQPGSRDGLYVADHMIEYAFLKKCVCNKLRQEFDNDKFERAWLELVKLRILNHRRWRSGQWFSLNLNGGEVEPRFQPLTEALRVFVHKLKTAA